MRGRLVVLIWAITRLYVLIALFSFAQRAVGDIGYYRKSLEVMASHGLTNTLVEYPLPAVGLVAWPWEAVHRFGDAAYGLSLVGLVLLTDGLFCWFLRRETPDDPVPVGIWLVAVPVLGAVALARFDILPAALVGVAVLVHRRWPVTAASLLAVAVSIKLWPALLIAPLVAAVRRRGAALAAVAAVGAVTVLGTALLASWWRVISPLLYQGRRGLQVETVAATPAMVAAKLPGFHYRIWFAPSKAYEVEGPGTHLMLIVSSAATVLLLVLLATLWWRLYVPRRVIGRDALVWSVLCAITGFIVVGKVLSPQYLLWLVPAAAAGCAELPGVRRSLLRWTCLLILTMGLTQLIFPILYTPMVLPRPDTWFALSVLAARNLMMVVLFVWAAFEAWRASGTKGAADVEGLEARSDEPFVARVGS